MNEKILFVDDDSNLLSSLERSLRRQFNIDTATGGEAGLAKMADAAPYDVIVSDRQMPGMDGIEFISIVRKRAPDTVRIMLTGNVDIEHAVRVVNEGNIFSFLLKPCPNEVLCQALENGLRQRRLILAERELLEKTLNGSIKMLTDILALVDTKAFGRSEKLRRLITQLSEKTLLPDTWQIHLAAMLSPIGHVTLPAEIVFKARAGGNLTTKEQQVLDSAPGISARLLANIPRLAGVAKIVNYQNQRFDGVGALVDPVRGEAIPYGARLLKILNDMLELEEGGFSRHQALDELLLRKGFYDPRLLASVREHFGFAAGKLDDTLQVIAVETNDLAVGMLLSSDVFTKEGILILSAGHTISQMILERIQNFKMLYGVKEPIFVRTHF
jgi:response regulator RpfG family c-di-GMP phosphodiesterase